MTSVYAQVCVCHGVWVLCVKLREWTERLVNNNNRRAGQDHDELDASLNQQLQRRSKLSHEAVTDAGLSMPSI